MKKASDSTQKLNKRAGIGSRKNKESVNDSTPFLTMARYISI